MALGLVLTATCTGEAGLFAPDRDRGTGNSSYDGALIGSWEAILLVDVPGDLQTWTTDWTFDADTHCRFMRTVRSLVEGVPRFTVRTCTWRTSNSNVNIRYSDSTTSVLPYSFPALDRHRLLLEGIEYRRLP